MSLFSTIDEIKDYLPVTVTFEFRDIMPYIDRAEVRYIIPFLSKQQYDDLLTAYNTSIATVAPVALTSDNKALLKKVRMPLANFAYMLYIPLGQIQIDSAGIRIATTENLKTAFQWQIRMLQKSFIEAGYEGTDTLLEFLEQNKSTYTLWAGSTCYTHFKELFINTALQFSDYVNINNSRRTFLGMRSIMRKVESFYIKPVISPELMAEIKSQINSGSITTQNQLLLDLIQPALANLTIARAIGEKAIVVSDDGIYMLSVKNTQEIDSVEPADEGRLSLLRKQSIEDGDNYLKQLRDYLYANPDIYPLFKSSASYSTTSTDIFTNDSDSKIVFL
jgi:hypothetical protein